MYCTYTSVEVKRNYFLPIPCMDVLPSPPKLCKEPTRDLGHTLQPSKDPYSLCIRLLTAPDKGLQDARKPVCPRYCIVSIADLRKTMTPLFQKVWRTAESHYTCLLANTITGDSGVEPGAATSQIKLITSSRMLLRAQLIDWTTKQCSVRSSLSVQRISRAAPFLEERQKRIDYRGPVSNGWTAAM